MSKLRANGFETTRFPCQARILMIDEIAMEPWLHSCEAWLHCEGSRGAPVTTSHLAEA